MSLPCCKARALSYVTKYKVLQFGVHDYICHAYCDSNSTGCYCSIALVTADYTLSL